MFHHRFLSTTAIVVVLFVTVGCGGGGGGDAQPLVINAQNAETSASQGVGAVDFLMSLSELAGDFSGSIESQGALLVPCSDGNVDITLNDVGAKDKLSTGDSISVDFQACSFAGNDAVLDGGMSMTASEVTDLGGGIFTLRLAVTFSALTVVSDGGTVVINGGFTSELSSTDGITIASIVSGSSLRAFAQGDGEVFSGTIRNFRLVRYRDTDGGDYYVSIDAAVSGNGLNGEVVYETPVPFQGTDDGDPESGTMIIRGANGATVMVVLLGEGNVELRIDLDGDRLIDLIIPTTWDQLNDDEISGSDL